MGIFKKNIFDISGTLKTFKTGNSPEQTSINTALIIFSLFRTRTVDGVISEVEESNVYMTSVVSIILKQFSHTPQLAASIDKAANYLITQTERRWRIRIKSISSTRNSPCLHCPY